jgi:hypothetical protein
MGLCYCCCAAWQPLQVRRTHGRRVRRLPLVPCVAPAEAACRRHAAAVRGAPPSKLQLRRLALVFGWAQRPAADRSGGLIGVVGRLAVYLTETPPVPPPHPWARGHYQLHQCNHRLLGNLWQAERRDGRALRQPDDPVARQGRHYQDHRLLQQQPQMRARPQDDLWCVGGHMQGLGGAGLRPHAPVHASQTRCRRVIRWIHAAQE